MPIKELSDRVRLPRLGKIHLGKKAKTEAGVEYPVAVDYFVCPPEVQKVYGEKPKALDIVFPTDSEEMAASQYYRAYSRTRGLTCKGDGVSAMRLVDLDTLQETGEPVIASKDAKRVEMRDVTCPGRECDYYQKKQCREVMNLQFLLPKVPGIGVWQVDTSSVNSIVNVNSALKLLRSIAGRISLIPLTVVVEPREVAPEGKKKTVHVLNIRLPNVSLAELQAQAKELGPGQMAILPQPDDEVPDLLYLNGQQEPISPEPPPKPVAQPSPAVDRPTLKNLGDLFNAAQKRFGIDKHEVLRLLGGIREADIADLDEAWDTVVAHRGP